MLGNPSYLTGEFSRKCKDDSIGYHTFSARPVARFGEVIGIEGFIIDSTERKQAAEVLREREEKFHSLFNNAEVGMFRTRLDGSEILDMNEKSLEIFGRTRAEMQGSASVIHWADPRERDEMVRRLEAEGRAIDFACGMLNKQGEVRRCLTSLRLYRAQEILEGSILDITERKQAEEALVRTLEEKNTLFSELRHRVKNTLAMIDSLVNLEAERAAEPGARAALEKFHRRTILSRTSTISRMPVATCRPSGSMPIWPRSLNHSWTPLWGVGCAWNCGSTSTS